MRTEPEGSDSAEGTGRAALQGTVLPPVSGWRTRANRGVFSDTSLDALSHLLDDRFQVPGTTIRFGLDGLIGLVPFAGDLVAGLLSSLIIVAAWFRGAPPVLLARMLANLAIDVVIGMVPLLGDAFDIAWKANRRNYALLSRHIAAPGRHTARDWGFLCMIALALALIFATPLIVLGYLLALLVHGR
ncbi:DUF4112 domain-containing protein [Acidipila sp. EB88]|nr:DUF4112 domain-containing protein [Acidipila sp. EB88]